LGRHYPQKWLSFRSAPTLQYIDNDLTQRNLASSTIRDRLVSLGGFWEWMGSRHLVAKNQNPWKGHRISKKKHQGTRPPKRQGGFTDDELVRLLKGNDRARKWETYSYLPDLAVLGMFTGARLESLAALTKDRVQEHPGGFVLRIENDKTEAGTRPLGVTAAAAVAVVKRRVEAAQEGGMLFSELTQGGADDKWSATASKAFGRYRRACDVPDGTDFHSYRRRVTNVLEDAGLTHAEIARFVGHKVGTLAADSYAGPRAASWALEVSKKVRYTSEVEAWAMTAATPE
jgi:integrase